MTETGPSDLAENDRDPFLQSVGSVRKCHDEFSNYCEGGCIVVGDCQNLVVAFSYYVIFEEFHVRVTH